MLDQAKHIYNLGGGKRSFGNVNLPMNLPSSNLPKGSGNKPFEIKPQGPKTDIMRKSKAKDLESQGTEKHIDVESQKSHAETQQNFRRSAHSKF